MYTAKDEKRARSLWKRYAIALSLILAVIVSTHFIESHALKAAQADAELINKSGKQRMLSQQILLYTKLSMDDPNPAWTEALAARVDQFQAAHDQLANEAWDDAKLERLYFHGAPSLNSQVESFLGAVRRILRGQSAEASYDEMLALGTGSLLTSLDQAVFGFETAAKSRAARMHQMQELTLFIGILVVLLEALLIFGPAHRIVSQALQSLRTEIDSHVASNHRLSNFIDMASDLYWETDLEGRIEYVEGRFLNRMKGQRKDLIGCNYADLIKMDDKQAATMRAALIDLSNYNDVRAEFVDKDGGRYFLSLSGKARYSARGELLGYLGKAQDISRDVDSLGDDRLLSVTDPLTHISNKRGFEKGLNLALETASPLSPVSLMVIDLDRFKHINDVYGHGAGDHALKTIATRIESVLRADDWVARTGGDEFCVVCADSNAEAASTLVVPRIIEAITQSILLPDGSYASVEASIGIAESPLCGREAEALYETAAAALSDAQAMGSGRVWIAAQPAPSDHEADSSHALA